MPNKTILITGAASGLGKAIATLYANKGWIVLVVDIQDEPGQAFVDKLNAAGQSAKYYHCDVGSKHNFDDLYQQITADYHCIDVLVNNAGVASAGSLTSTTQAQWERLINLDLMSVIYGTMTLLPLVQRAKFGHIVNIASFAGLALMPGMMSYNVAKAGVIAFSETLHGELALDNIGVSVACPAFFPTNLVDSMTATAEATKNFIHQQMQTSGVTAEDVSNDIYRAVENKTFMVISHKQSKRQYLIKRLFPNYVLNKKIQLFARMMKKTNKKVNK